MKRQQLARFANLRDGELVRLRRAVQIADHIAAGFVAFVVLGLMVLL